MVADEIVFGSTSANRNGWSYGITDLVTEIAESDSKKVKPTADHCTRLALQIEELAPRAVVFLHSDVLKAVRRYLGMRFDSGYGRLGRLLPAIPATEFFALPFPHGNTIPLAAKLELYKELSMPQHRNVEATSNAPRRAWSW